MFQNFKYVKHHQIDKTKWDLFIDECSNPLVYAKTWYLDIVSPKWDAIIDDNWNWVFPIPSKHKFFIPYIIQPMFCPQLGLFFNNQVTSEVTEKIISALKKRYPYILYQFNISTPINAEIGTKKRTTYHLKLTQSYNDLVDHYSESHRKNLRRAQRHIHRIIESDDVIPLLALTKQMYAQKGMNEIKPFHFQTLQQLLTKAIKNPATKLYYIQSANNTTIAGALFLNSTNQFVLFSARNDEGHETKATFVLIDHFIKTHSRSSYFLDFAGSDVKGIAEFNAGWGSIKNEYYQFTNRWFRRIQN